MSLSISRLSAAIITELESRGFISSNTGNNNSTLWVQQFADAVATAVVNEVVTNIEISVNSGSPATLHKHNMGVFS